MFDFDDYYLVGKVIKTVGLKGFYSIKLEEDNLKDLNELESVFIEIDKKLVPFFLDEIIWHGNKCRMKFMEVDHPDNYKELLNANLYIPPTFVDEEIEDPDDLSWLIGFRVQDEKHGNLGEITDFMNIPNNPLLVIDQNEEDIMIPANDSIVVKIDEEKKLIITDIPDGILDLN